jgi:hypothetical protein
MQDSTKRPYDSAVLPVAAAESPLIKAQHPTSKNISARILCCAAQK